MEREKKRGSQKFTLVSGYLIHAKFSFDASSLATLGSAEVHANIHMDVSRWTSVINTNHLSKQTARAARSLGYARVPPRHSPPSKKKVI